jgi:hypothetical protein
MCEPINLTVDDLHLPLQEIDEVSVHGLPIDVVAPTSTTTGPFVSDSFTNYYIDAGDEVPSWLQQAPPSDPVCTIMRKLQDKEHEHRMDFTQDKLVLEDLEMRAWVSTTCSLSSSTSTSTATTLDAISNSSTKFLNLAINVTSPRLGLTLEQPIVTQRKSGGKGSQLGLRLLVLALTSHQMEFPFSCLLFITNC